MGLKLRLEWYDKKNEIGVGEELSKDFGDDFDVIGALGIRSKNNINNGGFDVIPGWVMPLQTHFHHSIDLNAYDYQVAFYYRDNWHIPYPGAHAR